MKPQNGRMEALDKKAENTGGDAEAKWELTGAWVTVRARGE